MLQSAAWLKEKVTRKYYKETSLEIAIRTGSKYSSILIFQVHVLLCTPHQRHPSFIPFR